MRLRRGRAVAVAASVALLGAPAVAAPGGCPVAPDVAGDTQGPHGAPVPLPRGLDLLAADVRLDADRVTARFRVADLQAPLPHEGGQVWQTSFRLSDVDGTILLGAARDATTTIYVATLSSQVNPPTLAASQAYGRVDDARDEVVVSAPTTAFTGRRLPFRTGQALLGLTFTSRWQLPSIATGGVAYAADHAEPRGSVHAGRTSCIAHLPPG